MNPQILALIFSLCAMCANVLSVQAKKKITILAIHTLGAILFSVSFFLAGGGIGGILNILLLLRNVVFMILGERKGKIVSLSVWLLCVSYVLGLLLYNFFIFPQQSTAQKLWNILPVLGSFFSTVAFSCSKLNLLRIIKIGDSACWLLFDAHIGLGELGGILCEIFSIISIGVALLRFREKKQPAAPATNGNHST